MVNRDERSICVDFTKIVENKKRISFDEIQDYSPWLKSFFGENLGSPKVKSPQEVTREFNDDKWGFLLETAKKMGKDFSLSRLDDLEQDPSKERAFSVRDEFFIGTSDDIRELHLSVYEAVLRPHLEEASCLVELGAGYGSKLFHLAQRPGFEDLPLFAGEFTDNGCKLLTLIGDHMKKNVTTTVCDLTKANMLPIPIPENALIYTSYAAHYVPKILPQFVDFLERLRPTCVAHFEPLYEAHSDSTKYGTLCKSYMTYNDYTLNILSGLTDSFKRKNIRYNLSLNVISGNPLLPISVIDWSP